MVLSSSQITCLTFIGIGLLVTCVGNFSPFWEYTIYLGHEEPDVEVEVGLIYGCYKIQGIDQDCLALPWNLDDGKDGVTDDIYFKAVRVLMGFSTFFMIISTSVGISSCCRRFSLSSIAFEAAMGVFAGVTGVAGVITYAVYSKGRYVPSEMDLSAVEGFKKDLHKGWSFYLSCAGSAFVLLVSILSFCAPKSSAKYIPPTSEEGISNPGFGLKPNIRNAHSYS